MGGGGRRDSVGSEEGEAREAVDDSMGGVREVVVVELEGTAGSEGRGDAVAVVTLSADGEASVAVSLLGTT
jgi:hypothetical protein